MSIYSLCLRSGCHSDWIGSYLGVPLARRFVLLVWRRIFGLMGELTGTSYVQLELRARWGRFLQWPIRPCYPTFRTGRYIALRNNVHPSKLIRRGWRCWWSCCLTWRRRWSRCLPEIFSEKCPFPVFFGKYHSGVFVDTSFGHFARTNYASACRSRKWYNRSLLCTVGLLFYRSRITAKVGHMSPLYRFRFSPVHNPRCPVKKGWWC